MSGPTRRTFLQTLAAGAVSLHASEPPKPAGISDRLLDEIQRRACRYFYEMADPQTGLVRDRASANEDYAPSAASIAATGFGLSALAIAASRRHLERSAAEARVRLTLKFLCERADEEHGFFYHFLDSDTGKRSRSRSCAGSSGSR